MHGATMKLIEAQRMYLRVLYGINSDNFVKITDRLDIVMERLMWGRN